MKVSTISGKCLFDRVWDAYDRVKSLDMTNKQRATLASAMDYAQWLDIDKTRLSREYCEDEDTKIRIGELLQAMCLPDDISLDNLLFLFLNPPCSSYKKYVGGLLNNHASNTITIASLLDIWQKKEDVDDEDEEEE